MLGSLLVVVCRSIQQSGPTVWLACLQAYRTGDHELAEKLKSKLAPDDPVKEAQRKLKENKPNF